MWGICSPISYTVPWVYPSHRPEQHHYRFSRVYRAHGRDRETDRQTDRPVATLLRLIAIGCIC